LKLPVRQADGAGPKTRIRVPSHHPAHAAEFSWIAVRNPAEILQATPNLKYKLACDWGQRMPRFRRKMRHRGCPTASLRPRCNPAWNGGVSRAYSATKSAPRCSTGC